MTRSTITPLLPQIRGILQRITYSTTCCRLPNGAYDQTSRVLKILCPLRRFISLDELQKISNVEYTGDVGYLTAPKTSKVNVDSPYYDPSPTATSEHFHFFEKSTYHSTSRMGRHHHKKVLVSTATR